VISEAEFLKDRPEAPVEIPFEALSPEALNGIIENFILREGTDYGATETLHESKIKKIRSQLENGDIKVVFDSNAESVTLITRQDLAKLLKKSEPAAV